MTKRAPCAVSGILLLLAAAEAWAEAGGEPAPDASPAPESSSASPAPDPCDGVPCSGHGRCVVVRGEPACACEAGHVADQRTGLNCLSIEVLSRLTILLHDGGEADLPSEDDRRVTVRSSPSEAVVTLDETPTPAPAPGPRPMPGPMGAMSVETTPHTYTTGPGEHTVHIRRPGFENADVPFVLGEQDLLIDVRLSRPVHEWGIALTSIGGALVIAGLAVMGKDWTDHGTPEEWSSTWGSLVGVGSGLTLGGLLMVLLDRQRSSSFTIAPAPAPAE